MLEKMIKALMGDMKVKAFGPMFTILFCSLYFSHEVAGLSVSATALIGFVECIIIGVTYALITPPTEAEMVKARVRLARIEKWFGIDE